MKCTTISIVLLGLIIAAHANELKAGAAGLEKVERGLRQRTGSRYPSPQRYSTRTATGEDADKTDIEKSEEDEGNMDSDAAAVDSEEDIVEEEMEIGEELMKSAADLEKLEKDLSAGKRKRDYVYTPGGRANRTNNKNKKKGGK